jgi:hypothetical protein
MPFGRRPLNLLERRPPPKRPLQPRRFQARRLHNQATFLQPRAPQPRRPELPPTYAKRRALQVLRVALPYQCQVSPVHRPACALLSAPSRAVCVPLPVEEWQARWACALPWAVPWGWQDEGRRSPSRPACPLRCRPRWTSSLRNVREHRALQPPAAWDHLPQRHRWELSCVSRPYVLVSRVRSRVRMRGLWG